jgi:hypothetical protein
MSAHRRFRALVAASLIAGSLVLSGCESKVTSENFDKVNNGMSLSQVEGILGSGTDDTASGGFGVSSGGVLDSKANPEKVYVWREGGLQIQVVFKDGKVVQKSKTGG